MSLTPDYFITNSGYPELNRAKFKLQSSANTIATYKSNKLPSAKLLSSSLKTTGTLPPPSSSSSALMTDKISTRRNNMRNSTDSFKFNYCDIADNKNCNSNNNQTLLTKRRRMRRRDEISTIEMVGITRERNSKNNSGSDLKYQQQYTSYSNNSNNNNGSNCMEYTACNNWNWANDKEVKCFVNERIKERSQRYHRNVEKQLQHFNLSNGNSNRRGSSYYSKFNSTVNHNHVENHFETTESNDDDESAEVNQKSDYDDF